MLEARTFVDSLDNAREILKSRSAILKGEYALHNVIYASKDPNQKLEDIFLRLRTISKNIWNEKPVVVAIKQTERKEVGKNSIIPLKKEFDTQEEAQDFINKNYSNQFEYLFEFSASGWQYNLGEDQVDLENIEGLYSIEFKSETPEGLKHLLEFFNISEVIEGPSVVTIKKLLKR